MRGHRGLDGKVRQQVVLSLGGCQIPDCYWREIAHHVENAILGQEELLEIRPEVAKWSDLILDRMKTEGKLDIEIGRASCRERV